MKKTVLLTLMIFLLVGTTSVFAETEYNDSWFAANSMTYSSSTHSYQSGYVSATDIDWFKFSGKSTTQTLWLGSGAAILALYEDPGSGPFVYIGSATNSSLTVPAGTNKKFLITVTNQFPYYSTEAHYMIHLNG
ncbi:hypothetical protein FHS16_002635 [Paenibacillus endophyticus]|uniref:Uncharacterized protein n=1 Tax=Paenibacillus endophyticus TaxID=1294268 RepID=A0A7W5C7I8_9BACL|nr:hypothetical protein [Paenibacillus endophyticus]MBB3152585.1 hypothetical protein [Paenibacillus endophyticus]